MHTIRIGHIQIYPDPIADTSGVMRMRLVFSRDDKLEWLHAVMRREV